MSKVYTVPALADRWQCSKWFVYEQIRTGRLQAVRFGGKLLRVTDAEVARWENGGGSTQTGHIGSGNSMGEPSSHGAMAPAGTASASKRRQNLRADLNLMRLSEKEPS